MPNEGQHPQDHLTDAAIEAMSPSDVSALIERLKQRLGKNVEKGGVAVVPETSKELSPEQQEQLLKTVQARFGANMGRHQGIEWSNVAAKLTASPEKLWSLQEMERTGGEPDVFGYDAKTNEFIFQDGSAESPSGRRNCVYDQAAEKSLKEHYPNETCSGNAVDMAEAMGVTILGETEYRKQQKVGKFDRNSRSWLNTPANIRKTGDALDGTRNPGEVGVYQDDARNHDASSAFRGALRV